VIGFDGEVRADTSQLQQLVENLIRNAIEHGGEDVTVTIGETDDGNGFYIADDGTGIPESIQDQVFQNGFSTISDGTGFGLAIVSGVADAHGWEVEVTESQNGGARFEITGVDRR
jgi:signal transduction histidine kinase